MYKTIVVIGMALMVSGCAPRYSLRQVKEYQQATMMAHEQGMDIGPQLVKLKAMIASYLENPGIDESDKNMRGIAMAQAAMAINSNPYLQPAPYTPPMTFGEYNRAVSGR